MQDKNGKVIAYSAYNPNTGNNILMKPVLIYLDQFYQQPFQQP
jgi:hypothetical protein